jgi:competence protein ComEC
MARRMQSHAEMPARGDPFVWVGVAMCGGALTTVAPWTTLVVLLVVGALLARVGAWGLLVVATLAFVIGAARGHRAVSAYERARAVTIDVGGWPSRCTIRGIVSRSPSMLGGGLRLEVDGAALCRDETQLVQGKIGLHVPLDLDPAALPAFARGDEVLALGSVAPPYRFWNDGLGDPRPLSARRGAVLSGGAEDVVLTKRGFGVATTIDRARAKIRARILGSFPVDTAPMARALVLGEDDLPEEDQRAFRRSGLAHLLAVSGMHLVLVVMGFVAGLRALLVRVPVLAARMDVERIAAGIGLPIAWLYAELAGGSGSAVRAAWMCSVALLARSLARRTAPWRALGLSLLAMAIVDPLVIFDLSFVLSALATTGLVALSRPIEHRLTAWLRIGRVAMPAFVVKPLATTAAATIACAPILATMAPELSLSGLVANVVAVPLGEAAALPLCLVHVLLGSWPAAERGCATAASGALLLVRIVARAFTWGALPVPPPTAEQLGACVVAAVGGGLGRLRAWCLLGGGAIGLAELVAHIRGSPRGVLRVTFLDVGQGDSALVDLPDGSALLVDGGGLVGSPIDVGDRVVARVLAARRRRTLAAVVLSHPHPDHYLGLASALGRVTPGALWDTGQGRAEGTAGAYAALYDEMARRGVPVLGPSELCGAHAFGGAVIEVLAPCPGVLADRGANDNSFVIRIRFGERAILLTGDAEHLEEHELIERLGPDNLRADVLKVGHHGSRTSSTPSFLAAVRPSVAVISCGVRNRFGHPHPNTLVTLEQSGARVLRTDREGSVMITTDGRTLDVRTSHPP